LQNSLFATAFQPLRFFLILRAGGLLAYGPNLLSLYRLAGVLAGKVARGADPATLPIERPTKFETVLNMRTAHALGISIPTSLLLRADEVIE
jgi:putative tryptophan/tyrosine transport system substrate-binding protein